MKNVTITINGKGLRDAQALDIQIAISATINITPETARRHVTAWLVSEVGNMLVGGDPKLIISRQTVWRVPVTLTSSEAGVVVQVGAVDLDAESGRLLVSDDLKTQILNNVKHFNRPTPSPAVRVLEA